MILVSVITGASYKSVDPSVAIDKYQSAISLLCDAGRLMQAAKLSKQVAELFENLQPPVKQSRPQKQMTFRDCKINRDIIVYT